MGSSSGEDSPEWLRSYQPPSRSVVTLSSDSESSHGVKSLSEEYLPDCKKIQSEFSLSPDKGKDKSNACNQNEAQSSIKDNSKPSLKKEPSDSRIYTKRRTADEKSKGYQKKDVLEENAENPPAKRLKTAKVTEEEEKSASSVKGEDPMVAVPVEEVEMHAEPIVCSTTLPLVLPEKVQRAKALVECEGDSIDMSGDMGAVGRVMISDGPEHEMFLDLKGTVYKTTIVPSRTFCIVNFGQSEAKIEAIMNDFIQLKPQSNVFQAETMVEGTLDDFSFDSEDEAERVPKPAATQNDENDGAEIVNGKGKGKSKSDKLGKTQKKGKTAGGKPQKKVRKKPQTPKKARNKK